MLALPASSSLFPPKPKFPVKPLQDQPWRLRGCLPLHLRPQFSPRYSVKISNSVSGEPDKVKLQFTAMKERLLEAIPKPVKEFPWEKAEPVLLKRLLYTGKKVLQWSLVTLFICCSLSDVIFSISRNQELVIPFGLLVGCLMTDFLKEISMEMLRVPEEKGLNLTLIGIGCIFVLVKIISAYLALRTRVFLLHVANGGWMQVLWLWREPSNRNNKQTEFTDLPYKE